MNATIVRLTRANLLGKRRAWLMVALPAVLLALTVLLRLTVGAEHRDDVAVGLLGGFGLAVIVPLLALIAGTGSIGPEIDDGSIIYLLAKPVNRHSVVLSKLLVAISTVVTLGAAPVAVTGLVIDGGAHRLWLAYGLAALVAGIAYCALLLMLAVVSRNAVVIGLIYVLLWESLVGRFVPGAQTLSVQQWSLALARAVVRGNPDQLAVTAAVRPQVAVLMLVLVTVGSTAYAGHRLRSLTLAGED